MKVFISGASGVMGRRLVRQFIARGHSVIGQVRSAKAENTVKEAGGESRHADLFDAESLTKAAEGCDTVIHAARAIPVKQKLLRATGP
jgi:nucleoside-diphosphate-sugar epimerase